MYDIPDHIFREDSFVTVVAVTTSPFDKITNIVFDDGSYRSYMDIGRIATDYGELMHRHFSLYDLILRIEPTANVYDTVNIIKSRAYHKRNHVGNYIEGVEDKYAWNIAATAYVDREYYGIFYIPALEKAAFVDLNELWKILPNSLNEIIDISEYADRTTANTILENALDIASFMHMYHGVLPEIFFTTLQSYGKKHDDLSAKESDTVWMF